MKLTLYWLIQLTWGICLTVVGGILTLVFLLFGNKPQRFGYSIYVEIGKHWGGLNLGGFFFVQEGATTALKSHEYGHSFQNLWLGPLMPFLVTIPSAIRYHYRNLQHAKGKPLKPYDAFWCEKWATNLGKKYYKVL
ncbi:hypothetical protein [Salirhabdus sp. Marseille-P4669]|uniref:hypothetical protein n=1 Tax=Salirhabdus sp. Marseille-P4669 TaxID=2042310 RepID=UPI000C7CA093|nr:hypothetical protein [Salirhabdus sp. Marseille-P4669]